MKCLHKNGHGEHVLQSIVPFSALHVVMLAVSLCSTCTQECFVSIPTRLETSLTCTVYQAKDTVSTCCRVQDMFVSKRIESIRSVRLVQVLSTFMFSYPIDGRLKQRSYMCIQYCVYIYYIPNPWVACGSHLEELPLSRYM